MTRIYLLCKSYNFVFSLTSTTTRDSQANIYSGGNFYGPPIISRSQLEDLFGQQSAEVSEDNTGYFKTGEYLNTVRIMPWNNSPLLKKNSFSAPRIKLGISS